jgi:transposase
MKRTTKYVGMDVHQASTVASVRDDSGRLIARSILPTHGPSLTDFFSGMRGALHVAFEEGTQSQWLHDLLVPIATLVVCDGRRVRREGNKGDRVDADRLSELLRLGGLHSVYHGSTHLADLKELTRIYRSLVEDSTRVMLRIKALFRARAIPTPGSAVYKAEGRQEWVAALSDHGAQFRAEMLLSELDVLRDLRPKAKTRMIAEARRDPAWRVLRSIPFFGPVRVALLLATIGNPWRFRTKRQLWAYSGLAVVTWSTADHMFVAGQPVRRPRAPLTRGLNRNHNPVLKDVFKGAATAAESRPGPLKDFRDGLIARGLREELARVTLARKLAAITLRLWKTGELYDPTKLTTQAN